MLTKLDILTLPSVVEYQGLVGMEFWQAPFDFFDRLPYPQSLSDVHEITHQSSEQFIAESQKTLLAIRHLVCLFPPFNYLELKFWIFSEI